SPGSSVRPTSRSCSARVRPSRASSPGPNSSSRGWSAPGSGGPTAPSARRPTGSTRAPAGSWPPEPPATTPDLEPRTARAPRAVRTAAWRADRQGSPRPARTLTRRPSRAVRLSLRARGHEERGHVHLPLVEGHGALVVDRSGGDDLEADGGELALQRVLLP